MREEWVTQDFGLMYKGESLVAEETEFQRVELIQTKTFGKILCLDGQIQSSEKDENRYHQHLVAAPLMAHPNPETMVIIGGGDCYCVEEAVKFKSLKRILMLELDRGVVDFCLQHIPQVRKPMKDPRVEVVYTDARKWLEENDEKFDVIVHDATDCHGPSKRLFTKEFYEICRDHMKNADSIFSCHTQDFFIMPDSYATMYKTLEASFHMQGSLTSYIVMPSWGTGWTTRMFSDLSSNQLMSRLEDGWNLAKKRDNIEIDFFDIGAIKHQDERSEEEKRVIADCGRISTDENPFDSTKTLEEIDEV